MSHPQTPIAVQKKLTRISGAPKPHWVGDGFPVRSMFSHQNGAEETDPFLLLDYGGPMLMDPSEKQRGVDEHPHKGFETVTIVYQGELEHRDSTGNRGEIGPGDVQWMTAGAGIVHEEKYTEAFSKSGGIIEMAQLWVNLPASHKNAPPGYQTLMKAQIPVVELPEGAGQLRAIAGDFDGATGPAKTFTPISVYDVRLNAGGKLELAFPDGFTAAVIVLHGEIAINDSDTAREAEFALFDRSGESIQLAAKEESTVLILAGQPIDEPISAYGPFVMNTQEEIVEAIDQYRSGKMGRLS